MVDKLGMSRIIETFKKKETNPVVFHFLNLKLHFKCIFNTVALELLTFEQRHNQQKFLLTC